MSTGDNRQWALETLRVLVTLGMVAIASGALYWVWQQYRAHPWTRDGQVLADVAHVAAQVDGQMKVVHVKDNQRVAQGDLLFELDATFYEQAMKQAAADLRLRQAEAEDAAVDVQQAAELHEQGRLAAREYAVKQTLSKTKAAAADAAQAALATARLQLDHTAVVAPVGGYVTNLQVKAGSYVEAGVPQIAIVDADSFWVAAYFKETELPRIRVGDPARVTLIGYPGQPLSGRVDSIAFGIGRRNAAAAPGDLAEVAPMFEWIRLAQRIPVRIQLDALPPDILLRVGYTASVSVNPSTP